nr:integrase, catalytic region, zinc finger, CCHC-type, peptidase aspartic, catalytic [Tanacetum cinerariifolium]
MRVESTYGKKYILVTVDDYSQFTWVKFLRLKDEAPKFIIKFLKMIQVHLNATVKNIHTDDEFVKYLVLGHLDQLKLRKVYRLKQWVLEQQLLEQDDQQMKED